MHNAYLVHNTYTHTHAYDTYIHTRTHMNSHVHAHPHVHTLHTYDARGRRIWSSRILRCTDSLILVKNQHENFRPTKTRQTIKLAHYIVVDSGRIIFLVCVLSTRYRWWCLRSVILGVCYLTHCTERPARAAWLLFMVCDDDVERYYYSAGEERSEKSLGTLAQLDRGLAVMEEHLSFGVKNKRTTNNNNKSMTRTKMKTHYLERGTSKSKSKKNTPRLRRCIRYKQRRWRQASSLASRFCNC